MTHIKTTGRITLCSAVAVLIACITACTFPASAQELKSTRDSVHRLEQYKTEFRNNNFKHMPNFKAITKEIDLEKDSIDRLREKLIIARYNRNSTLNILFAENSKISAFQYGWQRVNGEQQQVFDANINLTFLAFPKFWGIGLLVNPRFNMRMFLDEDSSPIRTPSNLIGGTLYKHVNRRFNRTYKFFSLSFYHHSNGQEKGSYKADGTINTKTGNFAVNYLEGNFILGKVHDVILMKRRSNLNYYGKVGYQHDFIISGGKDDINPITGAKALVNEYGQNRFNLEGSISLRMQKGKVKQEEQDSSRSASDKPLMKKKLRKKWNHEESPYQYWRAVFESSLILVNGKKNVNAELKIYYKIPYSPNFLVTVQGGWLGHDYYNIYFGQQTWFFRFGVAAMILAGPGSKDVKSEQPYRNFLKTIN